MHSPDIPMPSFTIPLHYWNSDHYKRHLLGWAFTLWSYAILMMKMRASCFTLSVFQLQEMRILLNTTKQALWLPNVILNCLLITLPFYLSLINQREPYPHACKFLALQLPFSSHCSSAEVCPVFSLKHVCHRHLCHKHFSANIFVT